MSVLTLIGNSYKWLIEYVDKEVNHSKMVSQAEKNGA